MMNTLSEKEARLNLPNISIQLIKDALNLLIEYNTTERKEKYAINLFFDVAKELTDLNKETAIESEEKKNIGNLLADAYDNLSTISTDNISSDKDNDLPMKIRVWTFLKAIKENPGESYDKIKDDRFSLFPFLETIEMIFLLRDSENILIFPISDTLHKIFESHQLFTHSYYEDKQTFFSIINIALMVFKEEDESRYQELEKKINSYKLDFLLSGENVIRIDRCQENFKQNKVFIVASHGQKKIYIHVDESNKEYLRGSEKIIEEKNEENGYVFGYHVELDWSSDDELTSFDEELKSGETIKSLLKILFNDNNYNILAKGFLIKSKDNIIRPLNPYASKDEYVILDDKYIPRIQGRNIFNKYFSKIIMQGKGMNALTFGTLYLLHECLPEQDVTFLLDEIIQSDNLQNSALSTFISRHPGCFETVVMALHKEFRAVEDSKRLQNIKPLEVLLYPIMPNLEKCLSSILEQEYNVILNQYTIVYFRDKKDFPENEIINGDNIEDDENVYLINGNEKYYYYKNLQTILYGLYQLQENQALIDENDIIQYERRYELNTFIEDATTLQWDYYYTYEEDKPLSIADLTLMRLYYHAVAYTKHDKTSLINLIDFLYKLTRIEGKALNDEKIKNYITSKNALVVCKNVSAYRSSMHEMMDKYARKNTPLPSPWEESLNIRKIDSGKYAIDRGRNQNKIKTVCFIFDNSLSGESTASTLKQYFGLIDTPNFKLQEYKLCDAKGTRLLTLSEIIKGNNIKDVYVIVLYWTQIAKKKIEEVIEEINVKTEVKITSIFPPERELKNNDHLIKLANEIYGEDEVDKDCIYVLREFNQPKKNWLKKTKGDTKFKPSSITSIVLRKQ